MSGTLGGIAYLMIVVFVQVVILVIFQIQIKTVKEFVWRCLFWWLWYLCWRYNRRRPLSFRLYGYFDSRWLFKSANSWLCSFWWLWSLCSGTSGNTFNQDADCLGECFRTADYDECGICDGDNSSCNQPVTIIKLYQWMKMMDQ